VKKTIITTAIIVILISVGLIIFVRLTSQNGKKVMDLTEVERGKFEIVVSNTGELVAENSIDIKGPDFMRNMNFRVEPVKITDLVPEGTFVKKGDYIGTLDKTSFNNTLKDQTDTLNKIQVSLEKKLFDTAVILSTLRDDIKNQSYASEEAAIIVEQSKFEPPSVQRQAILELDKSKRYLDYKQRLYFLKQTQSSAEIKNLLITYEIQKRRVTDLEKILEGFIVKAPFDGMVLYKKDRNGIKRKNGSFIYPFDPVIATLPDLNSLLSKVYVSEVDINKIIEGQSVDITVDAFQGKTFSGNVTHIAKIGEQFVNSDSRVFEVLVKINGLDPLLRPSMTTGNKIITKVFNDVLYVPVESVQAGADSIPYVFTGEGTRQFVILGESNNKDIIIEQGLNHGTSVWLRTPEKSWKFSLAGDEFISVIKERARARKLEMINNGLTGLAGSYPF
jgi:multidrug efflux pump subunit AcrA (membrane-fusion protein)